MTLILKNSVAVTANGEQKRDIFIKNGLIAEPFAETEATRVIDCEGLYVLPGLFDMHVHFRDPGQTENEDIISGGEAAAAGGVTGVLCMPNTSPPVDNADTLRYILDKAKLSKVKLYQSCTLTAGMKGETLTDFDSLAKAGAIAATDDGRPVENAAVMREAMALAHKAGLAVISHCEDLDIINGGIINEGAVSEKLGVRGMNRLSENLITAREILISENTGVPIHIAHVSTKESAKLVEIAKANGLNVTAETAPHYFTLTETELLHRDADYRMNPPLRTNSDKGAITDAVVDGVLDCIITDHAPHAAEYKSDFVTAKNGVVGLETSLAATLTAFYHTKRLTLSRIVELMCKRPREILKLPACSLEVGQAADIAVADVNKEWVVDTDKLHSKSRNSCFKGMTLKGKVKFTLNDGVIVYED
ncbi:MAG: dihydroorotase [Oscillospiraceae bacterium]|jgi:dihydroorotase|nr:dihydroorotase [Oscillospiraceae bacterium]